MWLDIAEKRVALVVAHPDDETLAAGAHLKHWPNLMVIHVTDGAPRDGADARRAGFPGWREYAGARRAEIACALAAGDAGHAQYVSMGIPDQEAIGVIRDLIPKLRDLLAGAEVILTHAYEGGHPDHDACALACRAAVPGGAELWEFAGYHLKDGAIESGEFLDEDPSQIRIPLPDGDLRRKRRMLGCFQTQRNVLAQFRDDVESFRQARETDFGEPPHAGTLLYETWGFPLNGERWRTLASEALRCR